MSSNYSGIAGTAGVALLSWSLQCECAVDSFRIRQLASSQDGMYQIIELEEVSGANDQHEFAGLTLTVTNRSGMTKSFVFPSNLPSADTANKHVTLGPELGGYAPPVMDFLLLPTVLADRRRHDRFRGRGPVDIRCHSHGWSHVEA